MLTNEKIEEIALDYVWASYKSFARAIERAARADALEDAAKLVENYDTCGDVGTWQETFAERIRALINKEQAK